MNCKKSKAQKKLWILAFSLIAICITMLPGIRANADEVVTKDGIKYSVGEDSVTVIGYERTSEDLIIPETINEKPVTTIEDYAFAFCSNLTGIEIPESVTRIGEAAFIRCNNLTSIKIPNSKTEVGDSAFNECDKDKFVIYCDESAYAYSAYKYATEQGFATLPLSFWENPFIDVKSGKYYTNAVLWAYHSNPQITTGTSDTTFSPSKTCNRAQVVTFLWRRAGEPEPESTDNPFTDVKETDYFYKAVLWANETGVTTGTSDTTFSPKSPCKRSQFVTFLWRACGSPAPEGAANPFVDVESGKYYTDAVLWANEKGITTGTDETHFSPGKEVSRGQAVTFLFRARNHIAR